MVQDQDCSLWMNIEWDSFQSSENNGDFLTKKCKRLTSLTNGDGCTLMLNQRQVRPSLMFALISIKSSFNGHLMNVISKIFNSSIELEIDKMQ